MILSHGSVHSELLLPNTACLNLNSSHILSICSFTHWWNHLVHPQKMWRNIGWTELPTLGCTAANLSKANGWFHPTPFGHSPCGISRCRCFHAEQCDQRTITLGTMIFGAVFKQLLNRYCTYNLGSWYWTDWTHNHKTLKEIIESHVCCAHYPSPRIFPQKFHGKFSGKLRTQAMRSNDAWATPIPKRWSRRLWFAILMTPHRKEDFFEIPWN